MDNGFLMELRWIKERYIRGCVNVKLQNFRALHGDLQKSPRGKVDLLQI